MRKTALILTLLVSVFMTNRCTIIGIAVGSSISRNQHEKRPIVVPNQDSKLEFPVGEWLEIVKKGGGVVEGKYLEASYIAWEGTDSIPTLKLQSLKLNIMGRKSHETVMLNDIDHIVIGYQSEGPTLIGGLVGATVDLYVLLAVIAIIAINGLN